MPGTPERSRPEERERSATRRTGELASTDERRYRIAVLTERRVVCNVTH